MQSNFVKKCKVCGTKEHVLFHYGVCSCRACGSFFRYFLFCLIWKKLVKFCHITHTPIWTNNILFERTRRAESNHIKNSFRIHGIQSPENQKFIGGTKLIFAAKIWKFWLIRMSFEPFRMTPKYFDKFVQKYPIELIVVSFDSVRGALSDLSKS